MRTEQLAFELEGLDNTRGALRATAEAMVQRLAGAGRLDDDHVPIVALLLKLADALELSGGRGASVAMLSAQFQEVWERLATLPLPEADGEGEEFDVVELVPVRMPDAS